MLPAVPWTSFAMRATGIDDTFRSIRLEPWDATVAASLRAWREAVAAQVGVPCDHGYRFHMTIAYILFPMGLAAEPADRLKLLKAEADEKLRSLGPVVVRAPHLCHFTSMAAFHPVELAPPS